MARKRWRKCNFVFVWMFVLIFRKLLFSPGELVRINILTYQLRWYPTEMFDFHFPPDAASRLIPVFLIIFSLLSLSLQRIGYMAASQSFHEDLDILMLTTNMIRKVPIVESFSPLSLFTADCVCVVDSALNLHRWSIRVSKTFEVHYWGHGVVAKRSILLLLNLIWCVILLYTAGTHQIIAQTTN